MTSMTFSFSLPATWILLWLMTSMTSHDYIPTYPRNRGSVFPLTSVSI